jgi:hemoglobin/transferrin/lactoferrin receptor protein
LNDRKQKFTMMKQLLLLSGFCLWVVSISLAQNIQGEITNTPQNQGIKDAHIQLYPSNVGTITDASGNFVLSNVPFGKYTLKITHIAFQPFEQPIEINSKEENIHLEITLKPLILHLHQTLVVTAQRLEQNGFESAQNTTVLAQKQFKEGNPRTTPEALQGTTGVWIQKTNHGGGSPFVRGLTGNQTLLMIDGIRLNNSTFRYGPNQYLNTIDPLMMDRIEVLRGSGSVQYGSDALGGTVQIFTKTPHFYQGKPKLSGGIFSKYAQYDMEKTGRLELEFSSKKIAVLGGFTYNDFGDLVAGRGIGKQTPTGYSQYSGDIKALWAVGKNHLLTLAYQDLTQNNVPVFHKVQLENYAYHQFNPQRRQLAYLRWESFYQSQWLDKISLTSVLTKSIEGRQNQKNGSTKRTEEEDVVQTTGGILEVFSKPFQHWSFVSGVEYYHDLVNSSKQDIENQIITSKRGLYPDNSTNGNLSFFTLHQFNLGKWDISAGIRYNSLRIKVKEETWGESIIQPSALVGNLALSYALHPQHRLMISVSNAFRSPNIDDLGTLGIVDFRYEVPTQNLKPEKSIHFEGGYKMQLKNFSASISTYYNRLSNLITRVRATYNGLDVIQEMAVYRKENVAEAYIQGIETDFEYHLIPAFTLWGNLTYTFGQNITQNEPLRRIPPMFGKLGLRYQAKFGLKTTLEWLWANKQDRLAKGDTEDNRIPKGGTPGWNVLNLYLHYQYRWAGINLGLQNILNEAYRTHGSGVSGVGRSVWASLNIKF